MELIYTPKNVLKKREKKLRINHDLSQSKKMRIRKLIEEIFGDSWGVWAEEFNGLPNF